MDDVKLSKTIAHALRHKPEIYGLKLNEDGYVLVIDLLDGLRKINRFKDITCDDILRIVNNDSKGRYVILDDKIKACSGHSVDTKILHIEKKPPAILYHGTSPKNINSILIKGLLPMNRQYVHLSSDVLTAKSVGLRKDDNPIILIIDCKMALELGVKFYETNNNVFLATKIPVCCIKEMKE